MFNMFHARFGHINSHEDPHQQTRPCLDKHLSRVRDLCQRHDRRQGNFAPTNSILL